VLPSCDITCIGPQKEKLEKAAKECSCIGEWMFHSYGLRGILSFLIFLILNISRKTLIDGLARILWRNLHPGAFTVWATCDSSGDIITNKEKGNKSHQIVRGTKRKKRRTNEHIEGERDASSQEGFTLSLGIKNQLEWNSFKFRMTGLAMLLASISLNSIWIAIVVNARDELRLTWL
jgi:hypothetical protein